MFRNIWRREFVCSVLFIKIRNMSEIRIILYQITDYFIMREEKEYVQTIWRNLNQTAELL